MTGSEVAFLQEMRAVMRKYDVRLMEKASQDAVTENPYSYFVFVGNDIWCLVDELLNECQEG